ncbi:DNA polymerase III subunit alpha [Candidatus Vidania fulgoroideorum]
MLNYFKVYTEYSLEKGAIKIKELSIQAKKLGYKNFIINDFKNISGSLEFFEELKSNNLNPILGSEIYCFLTFNKIKIKGKISLLVKNKLGFKNICKIISKSKKYFNIIKILKYKGLLFLSGGYGGFLSNCLKKIKKIKKIIKLIKKFVIEIQAFNKKSIFESKKIFKFCRKYNLNYIFIYPIRFLKKRDYDIFKYKNFIIKKKKISVNNNFLKKYKNQYLISKKKFFKKYKKYKIYKNFSIKVNYVFNYKKKKIDFFKKKIKKKDFFKISLNIFKKKINIFKDNINIYKKRYLKELKIIYKMGFSDYFFIVRDFVRWSKKKNIIVGPGRGSSASSLVAYIFEITDVDPIKHGLYFERFLNYKKKSIPDFDIDFCKEKRNFVLKYLKKKYGKNKVFNISTFGKFSFKNSIRDSGRILGYRYCYVNEISKIFSNIKNYSDFILFLKNKNNIPEKYNTDEKFKKIISISIKINGYIRNTGTHSGGIIITQKKYYNYTALFKNNKENTFITQFDKYSIQKFGFIKFDFLCLNTLSLLNKVIKKLKINFSYSKINFGDFRTYNLFKTGNTIGIFQLESFQMRRYLRIIKPNCFNDLVNVISLYRPGPINLIEEYCNNRSDNSLIKYKEILSETRGILIFQEQLMKILQKGYNFNLYEADIIRSNLCKENNESVKNIKRIFKKKNINFKKFSFLKKYIGYSFNKAHAVSYSYITYVMAFLKANHNIVFYICNINYNYNNIEKKKLLYKDAIKNKILFKKPDINKSKKFFFKNKTHIYMGFIFIKGIGDRVCNHIIEERKKSNNYRSFLNFYFRVNRSLINKRIINTLIYSGCFDSFEKNKSILINEHKEYRKNYENYKNLYNKQISIFKENKNKIKIKKSNFILEEKRCLDLIFFDLKKIAIKKYKNIFNIKFQKYFIGIIINKNKINYNFIITVESNFLKLNKFFINYKMFNSIKKNDLIVIYYKVQYLNFKYCYLAEKIFLI